jgi:broad specificity phosphatase PhoE
MNLGAWEGMLFDEIEAQYPKEIEERKQNPVTAHAPDGESLQDVANRVITAVHEIALKHPKDPVLIVSHGIALAVITCYGKKMALANAYDHIPENMKILRMEWS